MLLTLLIAAQTATAPICADGVTIAAAGGPCPSHIFFDSGTAEIRREWEPVLDEAAKLAREGRRLLVVGHSDTPGSAAGNRRLARSRAQAVAAALGTRGVPAAALTIGEEGEIRPLVATADGVREIQNRRVSISVLP